MCLNLIKIHNLLHPRIYTFLIKIEILLDPNLSVYVYETPHNFFLGGQ